MTLMYWERCASKIFQRVSAGNLFPSMGFMRVTAGAESEFLYNDYRLSGYIFMPMGPLSAAMHLWLMLHLHSKSS